MYLMQFMQRCANKQETDVKDDGQRTIDDEHWVLDIPMAQNTVLVENVVVPSYLIYFTADCSCQSHNNRMT